MAVTSRIQRFRALEDLLTTEDSTCPECEPASTGVEAVLVGLSALLPDSVVQQALHTVDAGDITCVQSRKGRQMYEVRGKRSKHIVIPHGMYCSCSYFGRRVLEAGELCCKHWLAVRIAMKAQTGITCTSTLDEEEFSEWALQSFIAAPQSTFSMQGALSP